MYERDDSDDGVVNDDSINENNDSSFCMQMDFSCTVFVRDCIKIIITRRELERGEQSRDFRRDIVSKQSLLLDSTAIPQMMSLEPRCAYEKGRDGREKGWPLRKKREGRFAEGSEREEGRQPRA